ncbi:DNA-binding CsgD family transcriptional regulator [Sphingobium fontiphilum]|uniref:DNA-binding CsgD family transcriptional regulator n=1 Tax=Sphingobium fontiphilum TaxID=944425 RepID=A0A7W6DG75_9SPHN|nr:helix-turn-helix transcriptional regulator [Sphingobium fontiphilum]MBB3982478.1 DNA-binding CsgD family transcriptional regulator [Sphingobium fontiphilum]
MGTAAQHGEDWADLFLSAALEPEGWDAAIRAMAHATGSRHGQLIGFGRDTAAFNWISDIDASLVARAAAIDLNRPDLNFRMGADRIAGRPDIVHEAHYDVARRKLAEDDYLDLCAEFDIFNGCQTRLLAEPGMMIGLALLRGTDDGRTTQEQRALFAEIAGHARAAVRLQKSVEEQGFALLAGTFESMSRACWLIDSSGRVGGMSARAELLLSEGRLRISDRQLSTGRADETRAIAHAIRKALTSPPAPADPIALSGEDGGIALLLEVHPLPARPWALPFAPRAIVVARLGEATDRHVGILMRTFGLTRSEADIAVRLASGEARAAISLARGVSTETLKAQIRSIYEKTGCNRESQLVRLVSLTGC